MAEPITQLGNASGAKNVLLFPGACRQRTGRHRGRRPHLARAPDHHAPGRPRGVRRNSRDVINLCANNYLGLAQHPAVKAAASGPAGLGHGMASVRFICGTQILHKQLEDALSAFLGHRRYHPLPLLFRRQRRPVPKPCWAKRTVISDELNHASIIDGIRLSRRDATVTATTTWGPGGAAQAADTAGASFC